MRKSYLIAFLIRIAVVLFSIYQDSRSALKYTDVDYMVFTDASRFVTQGESPYKRLTYRYTPLLAYALVPNIYCFEAFGKVLFSVLDLLMAFLVEILLKHEFPTNFQEYEKYINYLILFNPIIINVSTRGNADQIVVVFVLAALYYLLKCKKTRSTLAEPQKHTIFNSSSFPYLVISSILYAISIHVKIYPIVYCINIVLYLGGSFPEMLKQVFHSPAAAKNSFMKKLWNVIVFYREGLIYGLITVITLFVLTVVFYAQYGWIFLYESYLYHFVRSDHRHNFSVYFYQIYLLSGLSADENQLKTLSQISGFTYLLRFMKFIRFLAFFPQFFTIIALSFRFAAQNLFFAVLLQTIVFICFNKVFTVQYFIWFIALIPLVIPSLKKSFVSGWKPWIILAFWGITQGIWLWYGYKLEFLGQNTFFGIWVASLLFFVSFIVIIIGLVKNLEKPQTILQQYSEKRE